MEEKKIPGDVRSKIKVNPSTCAPNAFRIARRNVRHEIAKNKPRIFLITKKRDILSSPKYCQRDVTGRNGSINA